MGTSVDMSVRLREAVAADLPAMARLHRATYSRDHFLALLPEIVLADYYGRFLGGGSQGVLAVRAAPLAGDEEELLGFAVFGRHIEHRIAAFKREQKHSIKLAAVRHPWLTVGKALVALRGQLGRTSGHKAAPVLLLSIAVRRGGAGVGRALLEDMLRRLAEAGEQRLGLYVRRSNRIAIAAYKRAGFRTVDTIADQFYMERGLLPP